MYVGPVYKIIKFIMYEAKKLDKGNVTTTSLSSVLNYEYTKTLSVYICHCVNIVFILQKKSH